MTRLPEDIKPQWLNVIRRLQSMSYRQRGCAIISISVVVNEDGIPVFWNEPQMQKLEPAKHTEEFLTKLIAGFKN